MTGFEAANATLELFGRDRKFHRDIIPVEDDEAHIKAARAIYQAADRVQKTLNPFSDFLMS